MINLRTLVRCLTFGLTYFAVATLTVATTRFEGGVAFLWIASALLIGKLSSIPLAHWPPYLVASGVSGAIATGEFGLGWSVAPGMMAANLGESVIGAILLRRVEHRQSSLESFNWLARYIWAVGIAAPLLAGVVGATIVMAILGFNWLANFKHMAIGHALGNLAFVPLFAFGFGGQITRWLHENARRRQFELAVMALAVSTTCYLVFAQSSLPLLFVPVMVIVLATFRLGQFGASLAIVILAVISCVLTARGYGPIHMIVAPVGTKMQFLQFYLAATVITVLPVAADLARRSKLHKALRQSEANYRLLADNATDIIMNLDREGRIKFVSPAIHTLAGYDPKELVGQTARFLIAPEYQNAVAEMHAQTIAADGAANRIEYLGILKSGERRWFETHTRAILDSDGIAIGVVSITRDISARKDLESRLTASAMTDAMTGLCNRRAFIVALERQIATGCGCVALFDLDHFKLINDTHGHASGDAVLVNFAKVAQSVLRENDILARFGGEEFALLLPDATITQAQAICQRLITSAAQATTQTETGSILVTVSGGVAKLLGDSSESLRAADQALYRSKASGRDRISLAA